MMDWCAIGMRSLNATIWALIAPVVAFMLSMAPFSGFTIILKSFIAPVTRTTR